METRKKYRQAQLLLMICIDTMDLVSNVLVGMDVPRSNIASVWQACDLLREERERLAAKAEELPC